MAYTYEYTSCPGLSDIHIGVCTTSEVCRGRHTISSRTPSPLRATHHQQNYSAHGTIARLFAQQRLLVHADRSSVSPVSQLLDSVPASVQQDAVRGQALILKQQSDTVAAKQLLADLVQSEALECTCQHSAQADYGTLLLEQGDLQVVHCVSLAIPNVDMHFC